MALAQPADQPGPQTSSGPALRKSLLMLGMLVAAGFAARHFGVGWLTHMPRDARGAAALLTAGALFCAVGLPRQALAFAAGYLFGVWCGGALALLAQMLGCAADFYWARLAARQLVQRWLASRLDRLLAAKPFTTTLTLRLLPLGNNLIVNLLAGISGLQALPFFTASLIGYVPQTAIFALAGSGAQVSSATKLALGAALFLASALLGLSLMRGRTHLTSNPTSP